MEEPSLHGGIKSGKLDDHSGIKPASDEGSNVDDPPPIPRASSSIQLTEKSADESRLETTLESTTKDVDIDYCAHTLARSDVAAHLQTDLECVPLPSSCTVVWHLISEQERFDHARNCHAAGSIWQ